MRFSSGGRRNRHIQILPTPAQDQRRISTCGPTVVAGSIKTDSGSQKHEDLDRPGGPGETTETVEQSLEFADSLELEAMKVTALREHRTRMCSLRSLIQVERNLVLVLVLKDLNFFDLTLEFMVAMMD